ncbi:MAG: PAS domain-containing protein [Dongiaceae bacterium]
MADFRGTLNDPDLTQFHDYWASLCRGRPIPSRRDLDPLRIPAGYLPDVMLVDVLQAPLRLRYRLIGTHVVAASGEDRTGRFFDDVSFFRIHPAAMQQFETVAATGRPLCSLEPFTNFVNGTTYEVDRLILPLSSDGGLVDMLVVLFHFRSGPHARRLAPPQPQTADLGAQPSA